ncbi:TetR family transcriptional regulator [Solwaraspora sp. WMMD1047]|uniref:acyl-CoA-like ligand-binding transcription factor n=1 Tax=Solwaraspora sp. WMMD1047 TaxID=3016102 RepID=UPI002415A278|nr:TetR family transcriptional regulator [Solwaraspora sp. WMMD1047]MDG4830617.1 TetR family transcriptional regulator [Solwaraspora sp. WMMD1047]
MTSQAPLAPKPGLRERKKAKTRATIREHAIRLFLTQGYHATTIGQISEAAEISHTTFFRYFPTKEDVVLHDDLAPLFIHALRSQPEGATSIGALREALKSLYEEDQDEEQRDSSRAIALARERHALILSVPELRARVLDDFAEAFDAITEVLAERVGRDKNDITVRTLVGAVMGLVTSSYLTATDNPQEDFPSVLDATLAQLEASSNFDL